MTRAAIYDKVEQSDVLQDFDIKAATKSAKIGWLKSLIIAAVWPLIKKELIKHLNAKIVALIEGVMGIG